MIKSQISRDYHFAMAIWMNSSEINDYKYDSDIQCMIDDIVWEDRIEDLMRISDFYYNDIGAISIDDQTVLGEAFGQYLDRHTPETSMFEFYFNNGAGRLYFCGEKDTVFRKIQKLS